MSETMTKQDLARRIGVHGTTITVWRKRKVIPPGRRIGRWRVWTAEEGEAIVAAASSVAREVLHVRPVRTARGWRCPECGKVVARGNSPAATKLHLRLCPVLWRRAYGSAPPVTVAGRKTLLVLAEAVIDGRSDPREWLALVERRQKRIDGLKAELALLTGGA